MGEDCADYSAFAIIAQGNVFSKPFAFVARHSNGEPVSFSLAQHTNSLRPEYASLYLVSLKLLRFLRLPRFENSSILDKSTRNLEPQKSQSSSDSLSLCSLCSLWLKTNYPT